MPSVVLKGKEAAVQPLIEAAVHAFYLENE